MIQAHCILLCMFYTKLMILCAGSSRGHRTPDSQSCHPCSCQPPWSMQQHQMNVQDDAPNPLHRWTHQLRDSIKQLLGNSGQEKCYAWQHLGSQWCQCARQMAANELIGRSCAAISPRALPVCHGDPTLTYVVCKCSCQGIKRIGIQPTVSIKILELLHLCRFQDHLPGAGSLFIFSMVLQGVK